MHYEPCPDDSMFESHREEFEIETINIESARTFRQYGGIEIFKRILLMSILVENDICESKSTLSGKRNNDNLKKSWILKIKCKCIHVLNRLICLPNFGKEVVIDLLQFKSSDKINMLLKKQDEPSPMTTSDMLNSNVNGSNVISNASISLNNAISAITNINYDTTLLQYLFSLLLFNESRLQACELIENILLHIPMLNLNKISSIRYILETVDDDGLSCICKIFAVTLSDLDLSEKKYWANAQKKQQQLLFLQQRQLQLQQQQQQNSVGPGSTSSTTTSSTSSSARQHQQSPISVTLSQLPPSIRDQNQELLLSIPTLLYRLVNLVKRKDYAIRYPEANSELEHWIRYIDQALSDNEDSEYESFTGATSSNSSDAAMLNGNEPGANMVDMNHVNLQFNADNQLYEPALLAAAKLNNFVHVLYTLSLLLIGKERKRVQKSLTKLRLASALNSLFDYLIWNCRCEYPANENGNQQQMRSHICPEVAVKIQFLRLVHSFCDHSEFKRVVLSRQEIEEILQYNKETYPCLQVPENILKVESRLRCTKNEIGLLSKIVQVIKQEPFSASFRFWLTRAIESFLRGGTSYADQLFLINRGIVQDTIHNILAANFTRPKEVLQSCFDMLGELVKFNKTGFEILNSQLIETEKFNMLLRMINQSLVDSNMFLRSIFLSIDFFDSHFEVLKMKISLNKLLHYFDLFERRIVFICRMINTINIMNLSQENVSCLNTTLVLLMLANRRHLLPKYLKAIKLKSIEMMSPSGLNGSHNLTTMLNNDAANSSSSSSSLSSSNGANSSIHVISSSNMRISNRPPTFLGDSSNHMGLTTNQVDLLTNFRDLLIFWQSHYLQKDKDCIGLEQNSRIEFAYWKHTVELLLDNDIKNECSLSHYMQSGYRNETNSSSKLENFRDD